MIARCIALGLPIAWVPIRTIYDGEPSHIRPRRHLTEFLRVDPRRPTDRQRRLRRRRLRPGVYAARRYGTSATSTFVRPSSASRIRRPLSL